MTGVCASDECLNWWRERFAVAAALRVAYDVYIRTYLWHVVLSCLMISSGVEMCLGLLCSTVVVSLIEMHSQETSSSWSHHDVFVHILHQRPRQKGARLILTKFYKRFRDFWERVFAYDCVPNNYLNVIWLINRWPGPSQTKLLEWQEGNLAVGNLSIHTVTVT